MAFVVLKRVTWGLYYATCRGERGAHYGQVGHTYVTGLFFARSFSRP